MVFAKLTHFTRKGRYIFKIPKLTFQKENGRVTKVTISFKVDNDKDVRAQVGECLKSDNTCHELHAPYIPIVFLILRS